MIRGAVYRLFFYGDIMKKALIFILVFLAALCPMYILPSVSASDFVVEDGVLLSYTGNETNVSIPDTVYYIADNAFKDNVKITKINLGSNLRIIGNEAFYGCTSLKEVNGGKNVSYAGAYVFYNTPFLSGNSDKLLTIGSVLLGGNVKKELVVDSAVKMIAPYAFADNTKLKSVKATDNLSTIGEGAFYKCSALTSVEVSDYLTSVGPLAFFDTPFVNNFDGDFITIGNGLLIQYKGSSSFVKIPEYVKQIVGGAFYSNSVIEEVKVPEGVSSIGKRAFANCSKLQAVKAPDSLVMIDDEAFARCKSLEIFSVPKNVSIMGESLFYGCNSLESVIFQNSADVGAGTFVNCSNLSYVKLSGSITSIGDSAFLNCSSLTDLSVSDKVEYIGDKAFDGCDALTLSCNKSSYAYDYASTNNINVIQCGDANLDGKVNIRDATFIQKYSASLIQMSDLELLRAEVNFDGKINVRDATYIQKLLAGMI